MSDPTAHDDRARDEQDPRRAMTAAEIFAKLRAQPAPTVRETAACACCGGDPDTVCSACDQHSCWAGLFMCEDSRTAGTKQRTARETAAGELAEAERWARQYAHVGRKDDQHLRMRALLVEYDELRRERDAARAEVEQMSRHADRLGRQIDKHMAEVDRLAEVCHAVQRHPDYEYSVTYEGNTAHTARDDWERNPGADRGSNTSWPRMLSWRRPVESREGSR